MALGLFVGAVGTAGAAHLITGSQIKNGSIQLADISKSAQKKLTGHQGPQGQRGEQGQPGPAGSPGCGRKP